GGEQQLSLVLLLVLLDGTLPVFDVAVSRPGRLGRAHHGPGDPRSLARYLDYPAGSAISSLPDGGRGAPWRQPRPRWGSVNCACIDVVTRSGSAFEAGDIRVFLATEPTTASG